MAFLQVTILTDKNVDDGQVVKVPKKIIINLDTVVSFEVPEQGSGSIIGLVNGKGFLAVESKTELSQYLNVVNPTVDDGGEIEPITKKKKNRKGKKK